MFLKITRMNLQIRYDEFKTRRSELQEMDIGLKQWCSIFISCKKIVFPIKFY
jgi:hypothetical protein